MVIRPSSVPARSRSSRATASPKTVLKRGYIAHFQFRSEEDFIRRWRRDAASDRMKCGARSTKRASTARSWRLVTVIYDTYLAAYLVSPQGKHDARRDIRAGATRPRVRTWRCASRPGKVRCTPHDDSATRLRAAPQGAEITVCGPGRMAFTRTLRRGPGGSSTSCTPFRITAIHVYNRRGDPAVSARANEMDVLASADGVTWNTLWSNPAQAPFGLDGSPLVVTRTAASRLPLRSAAAAWGAAFLHLDEVEVYGSPADLPVAAGGAGRRANHWRRIIAPPKCQGLLLSTSP